MDNFERAFADLIDVEGGYTVDKGGPTRYGVTETVARQNGYYGDMREFPIQKAKTIYAVQYWLVLFDQLPYPVAYQLFDAAVNSGLFQAVKWMQRALRVSPDGKIGPITTAAIKSCDPLRFVLLFNAARLEFMTGLSNWPDAGKGWSRRIAKNLRKGAE